MADSTLDVLDNDEITAYRRDGYLVPRWRLPAADLSKLQYLMAKLAEDNPAPRRAPVMRSASCPQPAITTMAGPNIATNPAMPTTHGRCCWCAAPISPAKTISNAAT